MEKKHIKSNFSLALNRKAIGAVLLFLVLGIFFVGSANCFPGKFNLSLGPAAVNAQAASSTTSATPSIIATTLSQIMGGLVNLIGNILSVLIAGILFVAGYSNFISAQPVVNGWVIVRDLCNMFFILILLVIAFSTILRVEGYDIKKMVPKLIIMAILINFSKTICGLIIDFAQVVMNTFLSPLSAVGSINMTTMLGLDTLMKFAQNGKAAGVWDVFSAYGFALIYLSIAAVVMLVIFAVLIVRIVMLWIYIVLSPLPYLLSTFPQGQKYVSQWWEEFTKNVIVGPVLAFFLWLSLVSLGNTNSGSDLLGKSFSAADIAGQPLQVTSGMSEDQMIKFSIAIGLLIGGLIITQQMGGYMGKIAGTGMAKIQGGTNLLTKGAKRLATAPLAAAKLGVNEGNDFLQRKGIVDLNIPRVWKGIQERRKERKGTEYEEGTSTAANRLAKTGRIGGLMALTAMPGDAWGQITSRQGLTERLRGGKRTEELRVNAGQELQTQQVKLAAATRIQEIDKRLSPEVTREEDTKADFQSQQAKLNHGDRQTEIGKLEQSVISDRTAMVGLKENDPDYEITKVRLDDNQQRLSWAKEVDTDLGDEKAVDKDTGDKKIDPMVTAQKRTFYANRKDGLAKERLDAFKERDGHVLELKKNPVDLATFDAANPDSLEPFKQRVGEAKKKVDSYAPYANTEARAAEQKAVNAEGAKVKDITDSEEKFRILTDAIRNGNRSMVKAIMKQMAQNGDDNEFLAPLAGDTSAKGIQKLMRALSNNSTKEDLVENPDLANLGKANFSKQEAMALGSEIGMINKGTNHWEATAPYVMEGGVWKENDDAGMSGWRRAEMSKIDPQQIVRSFNRLAFGKEDKDRKFKLTAAGVIDLKLLDNANGIDQARGRMIQNTAEKLTTGEAGKQMLELVEKGVISKQLFDTIVARAKAKTIGPAPSLDNIEKVLNPKV